MDQLQEKFSKIGVDNAPGQENRQVVNKITLIGEKIPGALVDFSHGDVNAFEPIPGTLDEFIAGVELGAEQAYTEYRGKGIIRNELCKKISNFTGISISTDQMIITPGTQGALFLAMGSMIGHGDKIAIVEPDYFANRKIAHFLDAEIISIPLDYLKSDVQAGLDLIQLEEAFKAGVKVFIFSNPNNPTGSIYSSNEIKSIASLTQKYNVSVIADELYSRQIYDSISYVHFCDQKNQPENLITIMGPSKAESLSGYRVGVAFGSLKIISRMEKLQAIVSLRAGGYSQAVLRQWFNEPKGWMEERTQAHQNIRDELLALLQPVEAIKVRSTQGGSYLFIKITNLKVGILEFVKILRIQANVIVTPGTEFGSQFIDSFRINFSQDHQSAVDGIKRTIQVIEKYTK